MLLISILTFVGFYLLSIIYTSIFYHRCFAHNTIELRPMLRRFVILTAPWVTGIDLKAWCCMHRLHHLHSDTKHDPHSPHNGGIYKVYWSQITNYVYVAVNLLKKRQKYVSIVSDLDFPVSWIFRKKIPFLPNGLLPWLPYFIHLFIAVGLYFAFSSILLPVLYFLGIMSHPIQGWLVNSFGHYSGYRNFNTNDKSTNNWLVAFFVLGEGLQNNHHQFPNSCKFSFRWFEPDFGYYICKFLSWVRLIKLNKLNIIPTSSELKVF